MLPTAKQRPNHYMQCNQNVPASGKFHNRYTLQFTNTITTCSSIILPTTKRYNRVVDLTIRLGARVFYDQIINNAQPRTLTFPHRKQG